MADLDGIPDIPEGEGLAREQNNALASQILGGLQKNFGEQKEEAERGIPARRAEPSAAAKAYKIADEVGGTATAALDAPDAAQQALSRKRLDELIAQRPVVGEALENNTRLRETGTDEDFNRFGEISDLFVEKAGQAAGLAQQVGVSAFALPEKFFGYALAGTAGPLAQLTGSEYLGEAEEFGLERLRNSALFAQHYGANLDGASVEYQAAVSGVASAGEMLAIVLAAATTRGGSLVGAAGAEGVATVAAGGMAAAAAAPAYEQARGEGYDALYSLGYSGVQGGIELATERIPVGKLLEGLAKGDGFLRMMAGQQATEGITEQVATFSGDLAEWQLLHPEGTLAEFLAERPGAAYETLIATVVGTAVQTTVAYGVASGGRKERKEAERFADFMQQVSAAATATDLAANDPKSLQQMLDFLGTRSGITPSVYLDVDALMQLAQENNDGFRELTNRVPSLRDGLTSALGGGVVEVKTSELLAGIGGTGIEQQIAQNVRQSPDAFNAKEIAEEGKSALETVNATLQQTIGGGQRSLAFSASSERLRKGFEEALANTGRLTPEEARTASLLPQAFYTVQAEKMGMLPEELLARSPLSLIGQKERDRRLEARGQQPVIEQPPSRFAVTPTSDRARTVYDPEAGVSLMYRVGEAGIALESVRTDPGKRGQGAASAALADLLAEADKAGLEITTEVEARGRGVDADRLAALFRRLGFESIAGATPASPTGVPMRRLPKMPSKALVEVAPSPGDAGRTEGWDALPEGAQVRISEQVLGEVKQGLHEILGGPVAVSSHLGGYRDSVNPSFSLRVMAGDVIEAARLSGFVLGQEAVLAVSNDPQEGLTETPTVLVKLPWEDNWRDRAKIEEVYALLRQIPFVQSKDGKMIGGFTLDEGTVAIYDFEGVGGERMLEAVEQALEAHTDTFEVALGVSYTRFVEENEYGYGEKSETGGRNEEEKRIAGDLRRRALDLRDKLVADSLALLGGDQAEVVGNDAGATREPVRQPDVATGREYTGFFANISAGLTGKPKGFENYQPAVNVEPINGFIDEYNKHRGNFDDHIAASIPVFRELQPIVGAAIARAYQDADVLDIGASEGALAKTITKATGGRVRTVALDPNFTMADHFNSGEKVEGSEYVTGAFAFEGQEEGTEAWSEGETLTDREGEERPNPHAGKAVNWYKPDRLFDVVHEAMVFQFISGNREAQVDSIKRLLKPDGVVILEEKFVSGPGLPKEQHAESEKKKDAYKGRFFTKEEIEAKAKAVGVGDAKKIEEIEQEQAAAEQRVVGMADLMVPPGVLEEVLSSRFAYVVQFWDSGNFRGYMASDSKEAVDDLLANMLDTNSEYSTVQTPRPVAQGGQTFEQIDFRTPEFIEWSRGRDVISMEDSQTNNFASGEGVVVEAIHATLSDFTEFSRNAANPDSDLGAGFYSTNTPEDALFNYAGAHGPDQANKIVAVREEVAQEIEDGLLPHMTAKEVRAEAERRLRFVHKGASMPVYVRFDNPVVFGGPNQTFLTFDEEYDEEHDEYGEAEGTLIEVLEALRTVLEDEGLSADSLLGEAFEEARDAGGLSAGAFVTSGKYHLYGRDVDGAAEYIRRAFERAGYDGFIDQTVHAKFTGMEGLHPGTAHFVAFYPNQIKSKFNLKPTEDRDILKQEVGGEQQADPGAFYQDEGSGFYSPLIRAVDTLQQKKGSLKQITNLLQKTKGVKKEEAGWRRLDDHLKLAALVGVAKGITKKKGASSAYSVEKVGNGGIFEGTPSYVLKTPEGEAHPFGSFSTKEEAEALVDLENLRDILQVNSPWSVLVELAAGLEREQDEDGGVYYSITSSAHYRPLARLAAEITGEEFDIGAGGSVLYRIGEAINAAAEKATVETSVLSYTLRALDDVKLRTIDLSSDSGEMRRQVEERARMLEEEWYEGERDDVFDYYYENFPHQHQEEDFYPNDIEVEEVYGENAQGDAEDVRFRITAPSTIDPESGEFDKRFDRLFESEEDAEEVAEQIREERGSFAFEKQRTKFAEQQADAAAPDFEERAEEYFRENPEEAPQTTFHDMGSRRMSGPATEYSERLVVWTENAGVTFTEGAHFPDEVYQDFIGHIRGDIRVDVLTGETTFLVDEGQSDWAQQGREEGFGSETEREGIRVYFKPSLGKADIPLGEFEGAEGFTSLLRISRKDATGEETRVDIPFISRPTPDFKLLRIGNAVFGVDEGRGFSPEKEAEGFAAQVWAGVLTEEWKQPDAVAEVIFTVRLADGSQHEVSGGTVVFGDDPKAQLRALAFSAGRGFASAMTATGENVKAEDRGGEDALDAFFTDEAEARRAIHFRGMKTRSEQDERYEFRKVKEIVEGGVADMPFKSTDAWAGLLVRAAAQLAVEKGATKIAFSRGFIQNARWKNLQNVTEITLRPASAAGEVPTDFGIYAKEGGVLREVSTVSVSALAKYVGADIAEEAIRESEAKGQEFLTFPAERIFTHGKNLAPFYDNTLVKQARQFAKGVGGKFTTAALAAPKERKIADEQGIPPPAIAAEEGETQYEHRSFRITLRPPGSEEYFPLAQGAFREVRDALATPESFGYQNVVTGVKNHLNDGRGEATLAIEATNLGGEKVEVFSKRFSLDGADPSEIVGQFSEAARFSGEMQKAFEASLRQKETGETLRDSIEFPAIEITEEMADTIKRDGVSLYQKSGARPPRGEFNPYERTIAILNTSNLSTFLHEAGHAFLELQMEFAGMPEATDEMRGDSQALLDWLGFKGTPAEWQATPVDDRRRMHEKFANSFEHYLFTGNAPSLKLRKAFETFAQWLKQVYRSLQAFLHRYPDAGQLNDQARMVLDRMLASEQEIAEAKRARGMAAMMSGSKPEGMSNDDFAAFLAGVGDATREAEGDINARKMRDMAYLRNAHGREVSRLKRRAASLRRDMAEKVLAEFEQQPAYAALAFLRRGKTPPFMLGNEASPVKLNAAEVDAMFPPGENPGVDALRRGGRYSVTSPGGVSPHDVAALFGFQSAEEMLEAMASARPLKSAVADEVDARMLEQHGELASDAAIAKAADRAIHSAAFARVLATQQAALDKLTKAGSGGAREIALATKQFAEKAVGRMRVRDIKPLRFISAESRLAKNADDAMVKNDIKTAAARNRQRMIQHNLAAEAYKAEEEIESILRYLKRFGKKSVRGKMGGPDLLQLDALLERFDLRVSRSLKSIDEEKQALKDFVVQRAEELGVMEPDIEEWLENEGYRKPYKELTLGELRGLRDAARQLEMLARREREMYKAVKGQTLQEETESLLARMREAHPKAFTADGAPRVADPRNKSKIASAKSDFIGDLVGLEAFSAMLGGGPITESLFRRISDASNYKAKRLGEIAKLLTPLFKAYSYPERIAFSRADIGTKKIGFRVTREEAVVVALLYGSDTGQQRLQNYGWGDPEVQRILSLLDDRDLALVNSIWSMFDDNVWPELKELNERTRGVAPEKTPPTPFEVKGTKMRGGYFPLKYHAETMMKQDMFRAEEALSVARNGLGASAKTRDSASKKRNESVIGQPILSLSVMSQVLNETVHDLAFREAVVDTHRLLRQPGVRAAIISAYGYPAYDAMLRNVGEVAVAPVDKLQGWERIWNLARRNSAVTLLSGFKTAVINLTGIFPAMHRVNPFRLVKNFTKFNSTGGAFAFIDAKRYYEQIISRSDYMRGRFTAYDRDIQEAAKQFTVNGKILPETGASLFLMGWTDRMVACSVWMTAYEEKINAALKAGESQENANRDAVQQADEVVRQTQGSGRDVDLPQVMRGSQGRKLFTMFYSYFNQQLQQLIVAGAISAQKARDNRALAVANFTGAFIAVHVLPAVAGIILADFIGGDDDDEWPDEEEYLRGIALYGFAYFPFGRVAGPYLLNTAAPGEDSWKYSRVSMSPATAAVEGIGKAGVSLGDILTDEGDVQDVRKVIFGVGFATGIPGKLIADATTGGWAFINGDAGPLAVLTGPPR